MPRYDSTSTSEIINKAENLVEQLDDICALDIDAVNLDTYDYNKIHDTVHTNAQKLQLVQEMQKLRMQCASYKRQIITLKHQIKQANKDKDEYHHLRKECTSSRHTRAQQRKVISRLYTQMSEYKQTDQKLKQKIKELTLANKEWLHRYQLISQNEKIYKRKSLQYQHKFKELVNNQWNADYDQQDTKNQHNKKQHNKNENSKIIEVLQSQLKSKALESTAMKRILLKYKTLINDNNKHLNELTDKIHYLQHQKDNPPKPIMHSKTTQTKSKNILRRQKQQHLKQWLDTIHKSKVTEQPDTHGSVAEMLHDLKLQILKRKGMYVRLNSSCSDLNASNSTS